VQFRRHQLPLIQNFSNFRPSADLTLPFMLCSNSRMTDRPASWRTPALKQIEKLAVEASRKPALPAEAPGEPLPPEYWQSVLQDPRALSSGLQARQTPLSEIQPPAAGHLQPLRPDRRNSEGRCCAALWFRHGLEKRGTLLLDNTCQQRTGRHEEDGCWPSFE
jgi:hypothetical protein